MINYKKSKAMQCVFFPFFVINDILPVKAISEVFSIFEIIGNLCLFNFQSESYWTRTDIYRIISSNQNYQARLIDILEISFNYFINSNDEMNLKTEENLKFISKACLSILIQGKLRDLMKENYSKFVILLTKLFVYNNICYIDQDKTDKIDKFINSYLKKLMIYQDNFLTIKYSALEKDIKKTLINWSLLHEIIDISNENVQVIIYNFLNEILEKSFSNTYISDLVQICSSILKKELVVHKSVEKIIFNAITIKIDQLNQSDLDRFTGFGEYDTELVHKLIREVITKKWPPNSNDLYGIFKFIFECNNFLRVFLYGNFVQNDPMLISKIAQIISLLEFTCTNLITGNIDISIVCLLNENKNTFFELIQLFKNEISSKFTDNGNLNKIPYLLEMRFEQLAAFEKFLALMNRLLGYFKSFDSNKIKISYEDFETKLKHLNRHYKEKKIDFISKCCLDDILISERKTCTNMINRVNHFDEIDKNKIDKIENFIKISKENIYLRFYTKESINEFIKSVCLEDFMNQIIDSSMEKYERLGERLKNGRLELKYFSNILAKIGVDLQIGQENELYKTELRTMMVRANMTDNQIEFRLNQLKLCLNLPKIKQISELILTIKEKDNLESDFKPLKQILESVIWKFFFLNF